MSEITQCDCPLAGWCERHKMHKGESMHRLCQERSDYREAWDRRTAGLPPIKKEPRPRGFGDRVSRAIKKVTGIKPCKGCKKRAATLNHWFPADLPPVEPVTLDNPTRHLMFHLWPARGYGAWQWNCDQLLANADLFNGRRIVAIVTSKETDSADAVKEYLRGFTDEFVVMKNNPKLREVVTFLPMLERLEQHNGPQDVTFACHGKCVRHKVEIENEGSTIFRWTAAMYETCLHWPSVRPLLERNGCVGSFRRNMKARRGSWGPWHYSGTFYWFRNRDAFSRNWRYVPQRFFGTEAWPGWIFKYEEAGCILGDDVGDLYRLDYWNQEIEPQLAEWRERVSEN